MMRVGEGWARQIYIEEAKRNRDKFAVKICRFGDHTLKSVEALLTRAIGNPLESIKEDNGWYNVIVSTQEDEQKLMALKGRKIAGSE